MSSVSRSAASHAISAADTALDCGGEVSEEIDAGNIRGTDTSIGAFCGANTKTVRTAGGGAENLTIGRKFCGIYCGAGVGANC